MTCTQNTFICDSVNLGTGNWLKAITDCLRVAAFWLEHRSFLFIEEQIKAVLQNSYGLWSFCVYHWYPLLALDPGFFRAISVLIACMLICLLVMIHLWVLHLPHCTNLASYPRLIWPIPLSDRLKHQTRCGRDYILKRRRMIPFSLSSQHVTIQSLKDTLPSISNFQGNQWSPYSLSTLSIFWCRFDGTEHLTVLTSANAKNSPQLIVRLLSLFNRTWRTFGLKTKQIHNHILQTLSLLPC